MLRRAHAWPLVAAVLLVAAACMKEEAPPDRRPASAPSPVTPAPAPPPPALALPPVALNGAKPKALKALWNSWSEPVANTPAYKPIPYLKPGAVYAVYVHLAARPYGTQVEGVDAHAVSRAFRTELAEWLDKTSKKTIDVATLAVTDPSFLSMVSNPEGSLRIDLDRMRKVRASESSSGDGRPLEILQGKGDADFVFGRLAFVVKATAREGRTMLSILFWEDGRSVEELPVPLCVATSDDVARSACKNLPAVQQAFKGIDSVRLATEPKAPYPDAALTFIATEESVVGVFHRNDVPKAPYVMWDLKINASDFEQNLADTFPKVIREITITNEYDPSALNDAGADLYRLLFPNTTRGELAGKAFEEFVRDRALPAEGDVTKKPSLYVRMVPRGGFRPLLIPLGVVTVDTGAGQRDFLGRLFRVEAPLEHPSYVPGSSCLDRWVMTLPPVDGWGDDLLRNARIAAGTVAGDQWLVQAASRRESFDRMRDLEHWFTTPTDPRGAALVLLGHHDANRFFFKTNDNFIHTAIVRKFAEPSVAILSGCGTGGPGALAVVRGLSDTNVTAIVAASFEVTPEMAGSFLDCLARVVTDAKKNGREIVMAEAHGAAVQCLYERDQGKYGARAFLYSLFGNGYRRLCPPA